MMTDLSITRGEARAWDFTVTQGGTAVDMTGGSVYFTVRYAWAGTDSTSDADAVIAKSGTAILLTAPLVGEFRVSLDRADTVNLDAKTYRYGVECIFAGDTDPEFIADGLFVILPDVVRAV